MKTTFDFNSDLYQVVKQHRYTSQTHELYQLRFENLPILRDPNRPLRIRNASGNKENKRSCQLKKFPFDYL